MSEDPQILLQHALESIKRIGDYTKGISLEEFLRDRLVQDSVLRNLSLLDRIAKDLPQLPWQKSVKEYFEVDLELIWRTIQNDLPPFKEDIKKLLK